MPAAAGRSRCSPRSASPSRRSSRCWTRRRNAVATKVRLRHPAEIPLFVFMVLLNVLIVVVIIDAALVLPFLPARLQESGWAIAIRSALLALLLLVPALIVIR